MVEARITRNTGFRREKIKENSPTITTSDGFSEIIFPALLTFSEKLRSWTKIFQVNKFYFYIKNEDLFQLGVDLLSQLFDSEFFFVKLVYKWVKTVQNIFFLFFFMHLFHANPISVKIWSRDVSLSLLRNFALWTSSSKIGVKLNRDFQVFDASKMCKKVKKSRLILYHF